MKLLILGIYMFISPFSFCQLGGINQVKNRNVDLKCNKVFTSPDTQLLASSEQRIQSYGSFFNSNSGTFYAGNNRLHKDVLSDDLSPKVIGLNINGLGMTPLLGISLDVLLFNRIMLEAGVGFLSASYGGRVFVTNPRKRRINYHIGYQYTMYWALGLGEFQYIPVGITIFNSQNIQVSCDLGPAYLHPKYEYVSSPYSETRRIVKEKDRLFIYGGLKIGIRLFNAP